MRGLVGARGAQDEGVGVERADDLEAGRQASGGEAAGHAGGRLAGQVERVGERRPVDPAVLPLGVVNVSASLG